MKFWIDLDLCTGVGACEVVCPELFEVRDDGLAYVVGEDESVGTSQETAFEPHPTLEDCVVRAEDACPELAIFLMDDDGTVREHH